MRFSKIIGTILLLSMVLSLVAWGCTPQPVQVESTETPIPTPIIPTKPTYTVQRGEVVRMLEFSARVSPVVEKELYFTAAGRVASVLVRSGDKVEQDQILATLVSGTTNTDVRRAEIQLEMAKLNRESYVVNANRLAKDYAIGLSMRDYEVELAQIHLDEVNAALDTTRIRSPFTGTVLSVYTSPDTSVEAYKTVIIVADLNSLEVTADPSSVELQQLQEGMKVNILTSSGPSKMLEGEISRLPYPFGKSVTANESADIQDKATHIELTPESLEQVTMGDLVRVQVILEKKDDVLWLPPQAIRRYEGRRFVVVQDEGGQRRLDVTLGIISAERIEIMEGLTEDQVVVAP